MSAPKVTLPCGHCGATGRKEAPQLTATLALVHRARWQSTQALALAAGIKETAMSNRLAELHERGYLDRRGSGSRYSAYEWRRHA